MARASPVLHCWLASTPQGPRATTPGLQSPSASALGGFRRAGPQRIHWPISMLASVHSLRDIWFTSLGKDETP